MRIIIKPTVIYKMKVFLLLVALVCLPGCKSSSGPLTPKPGENFSLMVGQFARIGNAGETLSFDSVEEDSRCPEGMMCFWSGNARIALKLSGIPFSLNTNIEPVDTSLHGFTVRLVSLDPYPEAGRIPDRLEYKATLVVTER